MKPNPKHISTINRINKFKNPTIQINWLLTSLIFTILVSGHGFPKSLTIGGKPFKICTEQGENNVNIGSIGWGFTGNGPVESFDSPSMVCNEMGGKIGPTPKTYAAVNAGDKVEVNWGPKWPESHLGPKDFWLGRCKNDCVGEDVTELSWFKIGEIGFDNGKWHHMEPIDSCTLPTDIKDGHWILRHTRIALHATGSPQIYAHCYRLQISGGGSEEPEGIKIPDDLDKKSEGFMVNGMFIDNPCLWYSCANKKSSSLVPANNELYLSRPTSLW
jgi:cellulase